MIRNPNTCRDCGRDLTIRSHAPDCPQLLVRCEGCGGHVTQGAADQIDISPEDEYYPEFVHVCPSCAGDGGASA